MPARLYLLALVPAVLLAVGGVAVFLSEDDDLLRLAATIAGGLAMSLVLCTLLWLVGRAPADGPRRRPGAARAGSPTAWFVLAAMGAVILGAGIVLGAREYAFEQRASVADARIVDVETRGAGQNASRRATVSFETAGGDPVTATLDPLPDGLGSSFEIRYDPDEPSRVRSMLRRTEWTAIVLLALAGAALCFGSVIGGVRRLPRVS